MPTAPHPARSPRGRSLTNQGERLTSESRHSWAHLLRGLTCPSLTVSDSAEGWHLSGSESRNRSGGLIRFRYGDRNHKILKRTEFRNPPSRGRRPDRNPADRSRGDALL